MKDGFLANNLVYIEREIAQNFNSDSMLDDFVSKRANVAILGTFCIHVSFCASADMLRY